MKRRIYSLIFTLALFVVFGLAALEANNFSDLASFFPLFTAIIASILALISVILQSFQIYKEIKNDTVVEEDPEEAPIGLILYYIGWVAGFILLIYLIGLIFAIIIFLIAFFIIESKFKIWKSLLFTAIVVAIIISFGNLMNLYWPSGIINLGIF